MTVHELKSLPEFFEPLATGVKTFEIRRNDRGFKVGDQLIVQEWRPDRARGAPPGHLHFSLRAEAWVRSDGGAGVSDQRTIEQVAYAG